MYDRKYHSKYASKYHSKYDNLLVAGKTASMLQSVDNTGGSLQQLLMKIMVSLVALSLVLCSVAFGFCESSDSKQDV